MSRLSCALLTCLVVLATLAGRAEAFRLQQSVTRPSMVRLRMMEEDPTRLISVARDFVSSGFGVADPSILSENFECSGQQFKINDAKRYVTGLSKETSAFRRAMPDFEFRPYDFEVDPRKVNTVLFKIRPRGTLTGPFSYKKDVYLPNKKAIELPLQICSVTIDGGKVSRVTAGYVIDRFTGNTGGLPGPYGVLYALGFPPSKLLFNPPATVVRQFFARSREASNNKVGVSPFPESVMLGLAKAVLESSLGASDPSVLADSFTFSGPIVGPLPKDEFVKAFNSFNIKTALPDLTTGACSFKVDVYEPDRVWIIARGSGKMTGPLVINGNTLLEPTGRRYEAPPEAVSVSFDSTGKCYKATAGYVIDREQGNTNGLGGVFGILEAIGAPLPWWEKRSIPEAINNFKTGLFGEGAPSPSPIAAKSASAPVAQAPASTPAPVVKAAAPVAKAAVPVAKAAVSVSAPAKAPSTGGLFSFLQQDEATLMSRPTVASKPAQQPAASVKTATLSPVPLKKAPIVAATKAPATAAPAPVSAPSKGFFSFLDSVDNEPVKSSKPAPAPVASKAAPVASKAAPAPVVAKAAPSKGFFSFLDSVDNEPVKSSKPAPAPVASKAAPINFAQKQEDEKRAKAATAAAAQALKAAEAKKKIDADKAAKASAASTAEAKNQAAANKRAQQEEAMQRFAAAEEAKKKAAAAPKPILSASSPAPQAKSGGASASLPSSATLSPSAQKALSQRGASSQGLSQIESIVSKFLANKAGPEAVYGEVRAVVGRDAAYGVFPDIIGSLPRGEKKTALNNWYQQQAV